jgi:hypothetical protein
MATALRDFCPIIYKEDMKYLRWIFLLCLVNLMGCLGHQALPFHYIQAGGYSAVPLKVIPVWIDKEFGTADQIAIDDAVKQWNYALNGYVKIVVVSTTFDMEVDVLKRVMSGDGWLFLKINSSNPLVDDKQFEGKKLWTLAWANAIGGNRMYLIRDRINNEWVTGITLHEMGHLLGADHDNVYLMQPHYNWEDYRCVDYEALKRVAAYQHLPMAGLNYCQYGADVKLPLN